MKEQQKPLTPVSVCDGPSPLAVAQTEIEGLKKEVATLKRKQQMKVDVRVLDLQMRGLNYKAFLKSKGLLNEFKQRYNY